MRVQPLFVGPWRGVAARVMRATGASQRRAERARDHALIARRFGAALDTRRSPAFARSFVASSLDASARAPSFAEVLATMGLPDYDFGRVERVLAYQLWDDSVLEFVGNLRVRELRIARAPRPRSLLREDLVSGPTVDRLWVAGKRKGDDD